jgi:hypothetical protein
MTEHPRDLAEFRAALIRGDRRMRRRRRAGAVAAACALAAVVAIALPTTGGKLDASALAAEAREALARPGILHSETVITGPGSTQRISRWSQGLRSHAISRADGRVVEQVADGKRVLVRMDGRVTSIPSASLPDPLLRYRDLLARASSASVTSTRVDGVDVYRLDVPADSTHVHQIAYLRRSDKLPVRVELPGGVVVRYTIDWVGDSRTLELSQP